jgi:hypothetical protein
MLPNNYFPIGIIKITKISFFTNKFLKNTSRQSLTTVYTRNMDLSILTKESVFEEI